MHHTLDQQTALSVAGAQDVATVQDDLKRDKAALDRSLKVCVCVRGEGGYFEFEVG